MEKKVDDVPYRHIGVSAVCRTEPYQTNHKQEKLSSRMRTARFSSPPLLDADSPCRQTPASP